jgi:hypothetical protein
MVLKKTEAEKKEARKAWDRRYYATTAKLEVVQPKVVKPKPTVDRNVRDRWYYQNTKARREKISVETDVKTTGEIKVLSGVAAGGNDLVHCNVDALNSAAVESAGVAARVTERHDADSAQDNDNVPGNSGCHDMRRGQCKMLVSTGKAVHVNLMGCTENPLQFINVRLV